MLKLGTHPYIPNKNKYNNVQSLTINSKFNDQRLFEVLSFLSILTGIAGHFIGIAPALFYPAFGLSILFGISGIFIYLLNNLSFRFLSLEIVWLSLCLYHNKWKN